MRRNIISDIDLIVLERPDVHSEDCTIQQSGEGKRLMAVL